MKRCPDCEFIYEDDQRLCDMDGQALVHDQVLSNDQPALRRGSRLKNTVLPAAAGLLIAGILSATYYAAITTVRARSATAATVESKSPQFDINSRIQSPVQSTIAAVGSASAMNAASPAPASVEAEIASEETSDLNQTARAHVSRPDPRLSIPNGVPPLPKLKPLPTLREAQPVKNSRPSGSTSRVQSQSQKSESGKKDSKLTSVLKKTGRVLSKPFKL